MTPSGTEPEICILSSFINVQQISQLIVLLATDQGGMSTRVEIRQCCVLGRALTRIRDTRKGDGEMAQVTRAAQTDR
jgi:hypothetical protein